MNTQPPPARAAVFPRVTAILESVGLGADYLGVPPAVLEAARVRGVAVHDAIEAEVYGYYARDALLSEDVRARMDAYRAFVKESRYQTLHTELEVRDVTWRYRGHPDSIGWMDTERVVVDWKAQDAVQLAPSALQVTAYALAWQSQHPHERIQYGVVVQLKSDGTYHAHTIECAVHTALWRSAVLVYHARQDRPHAQLSSAQL